MSTTTKFGIHLIYTVMPQNEVVLSWILDPKEPAYWRSGRDGVDTTGSGPWETDEPPGEGGSRTFKNLKPGSEYNFWVEAYVGRGNVRATVKVKIPSTDPIPTPQPVPEAPVVNPPVSTTRNVPVMMNGFYRGGFPNSGHGAFTTIKTKLLKQGGDVFISENFQWKDWNVTKNGGGSYPAWETWLKGDQRRRAVLSVGLVPSFGPAGDWETKKGTDAQVSASLQAGAEGKFDIHWIEFAKNLNVSPELLDAIVRVAWEFNGGWYPFRAGANKKAFRAYLVRVYRIIRKYAPKALIDWNYSGGSSDALRNGTGATVGNILEVFPTEELPDFIGVDAYDQRGSMDPVNGWTNKTMPELKFARDLAAKHGIMMSIPEYGVWDVSRNKVSPDNPHYIRNMHAWIHNPLNRVGYAIYFEVDAEDGRHALTTSDTAFPKSRDEFAKLRWNTISLEALNA